MKTLTALRSDDTGDEASDDDGYFSRQDRGFPDEEISAVIDVSDHLERKVAALRAHRSQIPNDWFLLTVPEEVRRTFFGTESYLRLYSSVESALPETDLFAGLR
jgi:N-acetyl-1-D-myo-inositol-2-amino-2-deoxy-alpha-D-glucopyranoside deacetylase